MTVRRPGLVAIGVSLPPTSTAARMETWTDKHTRMIRVSASLIIRRARGKVKVREEGRCRMCRRVQLPEHLNVRVDDPAWWSLAQAPSGSRPLSGHHLVPQRWFKFQPDNVRLLAHVDANIVPLCRACHDLVESSDSTVRVPARRMLRRVLGQDEVTFAIQVRGQGWFDHQYPFEARPASKPAGDSVDDTAPDLRYVTGYAFGDQMLRKALKSPGLSARLRASTGWQPFDR